MHCCQWEEEEEEHNPKVKRMLWITCDAPVAARYKMGVLRPGGKPHESKPEEEKLPPESRQRHCRRPIWRRRDEDDGDEPVDYAHARLSWSIQFTRAPQIDTRNGFIAGRRFDALVILNLSVNLSKNLLKIISMYRFSCPIMFSRSETMRELSMVV